MSLFEKLQQSLHSTHTGPVWGWAYTVQTQALCGARPTQYTHRPCMGLGLHSTLHTQALYGAGSTQYTHKHCVGLGLHITVHTQALYGAGSTQYAHRPCMGLGLHSTHTSTVWG